MTKVMISLPDQIKLAADRRAKAEGRTRSELIREALRHFLVKDTRVEETADERRQRLEKIFQSWRATGRKLGRGSLSKTVLRQREKLAQRLG